MCLNVFHTGEAICCKGYWNKEILKNGFQSAVISNNTLIGISSSTKNLFALNIETQEVICENILKEESIQQLSGNCDGCKVFIVTISNDKNKEFKADQNSIVFLDVNKLETIDRHLLKEKVNSISCGNDHCVITTNNNQVLTWGIGR